MKQIDANALLKELRNWQYDEDDLEDDYKRGYYAGIARAIRFTEKQPAVGEPLTYQLTPDDVENEDYIPTVIWVKPLNVDIEITAGVWQDDHYEMGDGTVWGDDDLRHAVRTHAVIAWVCDIPEPPEVTV